MLPTRNYKEPEKLSKRDLLKELGYSSGYNQYGINLLKDLEGNRTAAQILLSLNKLRIERKDLLRFNLIIDTYQDSVDVQTGEIQPLLKINESFETEPLFKLWHAIYSIEEDESLKKVLINNFSLPEEAAKVLVKLDFHRQGYGNLSARAIRKILPYLMKGENFAKSCLCAGYRHSDYLSSEENMSRSLQEKLENISKNSLRNPVVEKIINHTINVVNDILTVYGRPDEIRIELARELRQNAVQRKRTFQNIGKLDKKHHEIEEILRNELGFSRVTRSDIERYKLWEEFGKISPYEPSRPVSLTELFSGGYDIEHIIPKSRMFDDSFTNKTICPRSMNTGEGAKNQMTAYDFMKSKGPEIFSEYVEFVTNAYKEGKIGKGKFERLLMPEDNIPDDFINRQLSDTRYISREIKKILTKVVRNVYSTIGSITDYQRYMWGYDLILQRLNWEKFEKAGLTEIQHDKNGNRVYTIKNWSKRDDQRHHAIDALIIASTTNDTIKRLNDLNKIVKTKAGQSQQEALKESALLGVEEFVRSKCPFPESEVLLAAGKTLISFKSGKRVAISNKNAYRYRKGEKPVQITLTPRGFLHKEKVYGKILRYEEVKLSPRFNRFGDIAFSSSKIFLSGFLTQYNNDIKKAFSVKGIKKLMNQMNGKSIQGLEIGESAVWVTVFKPEFVISYPLKELKAKDVKFVIDKKVRDILLKRIENYGEKEAFKDIHNDPVWFNEEKKIPIKSSRIISGYDDLIPLHSTNKGFTFSRKSTVDQAIPVDYVVPRNNHHIAIYRDEKGNLQENVVTLMDALTRKHAGIPVVIKNPKSVWDYILEKQIDINDELKNLPEDSWRFVTSMQQNEMFIFDMDAEAINNAIERNDYLILSQHLYRVQKLTSKYYSFRHHLETQVDDKKIGGEKVSILLGRYKRITDMKKMTGIKVKVNRLGKIEKIGE